MAPQSEPTFLIVDLFCGAGGTTTGFAQAVIEGNNIANVIACVNHDAKAIESHWMNHPEVEHFEEDITVLYGHIEYGILFKSPEFMRLIRLANIYRAFYPDTYMILWASLECTNFSKAKGGKERDADSRTLADHLHSYITGIDPDYIQIENVVEFMSWGPLDELGKPISKKNGQDFMRWRREVCEHGYTDENGWTELNSANFGAFTSRNRLFGCFAKHGLPIVWPQATHSKNPIKNGMFEEDMQKWKAVKEVLDFTDEGESIFTRKKELSDKTLERIIAGLVKYVAKGDKAFISKYFSGRPANKNISVDGPAGTIKTVDGQALVNAEFLLQTYAANSKGHNTFATDAPARTITTRDATALVQPKFIVTSNGGIPTAKVYSTDQPSRVITTSDNQALVQTYFLTHYYGRSGQHSSVEQPAPVIPCKARTALISPEFLTIYNGKSLHRSVDEPCPVIATNDRFNLVQPEFIVNYNHSSKTNDVNEPAPAILAADKLAIAQPEFFIDKHFGTAQNQSINQPAGTIMPNDKHRLVEAVPFIMPTNYDNAPKSIEEPAPTITANRKHHYIVNPSWGGNPGSIDQPCCVVVARQDKAPLYFVQVEEGPVRVAIYDSDTETMIRIKQFMSLYGLVDIKMRMLRVHELLKIQGFPNGYHLAGNQSDQKKFIGNSVVPHVVKAWAEAMATNLTKKFKKVA